jgi:MFS family permease
VGCMATEAFADAPASSRSVRTTVPLAVLLVGQFMANVDIAVVNVAAPAIRRDLHTGGGQLQLVVSGFVLAYAMLLITGARLGAMYGYRRLFVIGAAGFTTASLACGLATGPVVLTVARFAQGAAAGLMVPQVLTGIQTMFRGPRRTRALGYYTLALSGGAVVGQILGGVLVWANLFGSAWRPIFLINVPVGVALVVAAACTLPGSDHDPRQQLDLRGVALLALTVTLAVLPLVLGRELGWPAWTWIALAASPAAMVWFVGTERNIARQHGRPLVNLDVLRRPAIGWGLLGWAATVSTYYAMLFILALYLQQGVGRSPLYSGFALVSWVAAFGAAGPLLRRLPDTLSRPSRSAPGGALILAVAHAGIATGLAVHLLTDPVLVTLLGLGGFGLGVTFTALMTHMTANVPASNATDLSGLIPTNTQLAGVVGVTVFGAGYLALATRSPGEAFAAVTVAFAVTSGLAAAAAHRSTTTAVSVGGHEDGTSNLEER